MNRYEYFFLFVLASLFCSYSTSLKVLGNRGESFIGVYQYGNEVLHIMPDHVFFIRRTQSKTQNDVAVPMCYDTLAKGTWKLAKSGVLELKNSGDYEKVSFIVRQEKKLSEDSVYVEIQLPKDDAFFDGRFEYNLFCWDRNGGGGNVGGFGAEGMVQSKQPLDLTFNTPSPPGTTETIKSSVPFFSAVETPDGNGGVNYIGSEINLISFKVGLVYGIDVSLSLQTNYD